MLLRKAKTERCSKCNSYIKEIESEQYGCDTCRKPIDLVNDKENRYAEYLQITVFHSTPENRTENYEFCSWKCLFKKLRTIKTDYFITLPYLAFDRTLKGMSVKDFFDCIKT